MSWGMRCAWITLQGVYPGGILKDCQSISRLREDEVVTTGNLDLRG